MKRRVGTIGYRQGRKRWFLLHEKGGKFYKVPAHSEAVENLDAYLTTAGREGARKTHLF